ncbi:MAG: pyridoxal 5'-phosphate synthase glutaminase subunit PdxT [Clostridiales bacterium]|nr:pyridoxal 5'-phosphate synthase glutaminase subunit PdxT [Clostridiales bacterium]
MIGVLALQGGFIEHINALRKLGVPSFEIRQKADLINKDIKGLIFPGGESTVIGKLLCELELFDPLDRLIKSGIPVFGTCAGLILLAKKIVNDDSVYFEAIDIAAKRNAFGRQLGSFHTTGDFADLKNVEMTFIRAPYIEQAASDVKVLSKINEHIVAAMQRNVLVTAFHPELTNDLRVHEFFIKNL